jgi:acid phosphatase (class A)
MKKVLILMAAAFAMTTAIWAQSDVEAGRLAASAAYAKLHTSERFLEQMRLARQEFRIKKGLATPAEVKAWQKAAKKRK